MSVRSLTLAATASTLLGIGGLHVAWGRGSTFPFVSRDRLNDVVVGRDATPSPGACYGIAGLLTAAAGLVAGLPTRRGRLRRAGVCTVALTLGTRAGLGFAGKTALVSPGSVSPTFVRMDRRVLAPLCAALAAGAVASLPA